MIIDVKRISVQGERLVGEEPSSVLELEPDIDVVLTKPLHYELKVLLVSGELVVMGKLSMEANCRCSRCCERFDTQVVDTGFDAVIEVQDPNESVDLTPHMRESMLLALPSYPVCSSGCKGLCSQCGTNLNRGQCSCGGKQPRGWEALDGLKLDK